MDFAYASGSLSVKIAELKKIEAQLTNLEQKGHDEIISFLNHLQIAGNQEINDFKTLINKSEQYLFNQVVSLVSENDYALLDLIYAEDIITFLNLKVNNVKYLDRFAPYDVFHLSLTQLLDDQLPGYQDHYGRMLREVNRLDKKSAREKEAKLTQLFYQHLGERFMGHPYLISKIIALNVRTLYRAKKLSLSLDDFKIELLGDDVIREKFSGLFRLDERQIVATLKDKFDSQTSQVFEAILQKPQDIDRLIDQYIYDKVKDMIFSVEFQDLFILYGYLYRRMIRQIKKIYYRVEAYETDRHY